MIIVDQVEFDASNSFEIVVSNAETNEAIQFNYNHQVRRETWKIFRLGGAAVILVFFFAEQCNVNLARPLWVGRL